MWFTEEAGNNIGRITPAGVIHEFPLPEAGSGPVGITAGSDGRIWFTEQLGNNIAAITTSRV
jgi:virginiamycin B lyase